MIFRIVSIFLIFTTSTTMSFADEATDKAEFKKLYVEFNELYANSEEIEPIIEVAEKLYEMAPVLYGEHHANTAVVTFNLAMAYLENAKKTSANKPYSDAAEIFDEYFNILEKNDAPKDKNYVFQYLQYMHALSLEGKSRSLSKHTNKVRNVAKSLDYSVAEFAEIEFSLGYYAFVDSDMLLSIKHFKRSQELYHEAYGEEHIKTGESAFWTAKIEMAQKKRKAAEKNFLMALNAFEKNDQMGSNLAQTTHAFLVGLYEEMGQSDKATKHCQAVAEERPKDFDRYITPLYRKNPEMPQLSRMQAIKMQKESVDVLLEFDVDENGFTKNVKVIESDDDKFNKNSIEAAEGYRYAPKVEDGKIVETHGAKVMISYRIAR